MKLIAWFLDLDKFPVSDNFSGFSESERRRLMQSPAGIPRRRLAASFVMRRNVLSAFYGVSDNALVTLSDKSELSVGFNPVIKLPFSRQAGLAVLVVAQRQSIRPIGVDLVAVADLDTQAATELVETIQAPGEQISPSDAHQHCAAKEAVVKAAGCGLWLHPRRSARPMS